MYLCIILYSLTESNANFLLHVCVKERCFISFLDSQHYETIGTQEPLKELLKETLEFGIVHIKLEINLYTTDINKTMVFTANAGWQLFFITWMYMCYIEDIT